MRTSSFELASFVHAAAAVALITALLAGLVVGACTAPVAEELSLSDLSGRPVRPFGAEGAKATVCLFVMTDCPISNRYAPEVARLYRKFEPLGVDFRLVYPVASDSPAAIRRHVEEYGYPCQALRDPEQKLVALTGATVTPEAVVFGPDRSMVYRGRIDDQNVDFGKVRREALEHDLERVLSALVAGEQVPFQSTTAIGCFIPEPE